MIHLTILHTFHRHLTISNFLVIKNIYPLPILKLETLDARGSIVEDENEHYIIRIEDENEDEQIINLFAK